MVDENPDMEKRIAQEQNLVIVLKMLRKLMKNGKLSAGPGRNLELEKIIENLEILESFYTDDNKYQKESGSVVV